MGIPEILLFITAILAFLLTGLIYFRGVKNRVTISFALLTLSGGLWALVIPIFRISDDLIVALFWNRMIYIVGSIVPCLFVYFSRVFPHRTKPFPLFKQLTIFLPFILFAISLFWGNFFIQEISINEEGNRAILGPLYSIWVIWFSIFMAWSFFGLLINYRKAARVYKIQLRYVLLSIAFPAALSFPFNIILPWLGDYRHIWVGPISILIMVAIIAYAITRYRFMDIRLIFRKSFVYLITLILVVIVGVVIMYLDTRIFQGVIPSSIMGGLILIIGVLLFNPLRNMLQNLADKLMFKEVLSYRQAIQKLSQEVMSLISLKKINSIVVDTLIKTMRLDKVGILLMDPKTDNFQPANIIGFKEENGISLVRSNFLTKYLEEKKQPVVYQELEVLINQTDNKKKKSEIEKLKTNMKRIEAGACLPLFKKKGLGGIIVLGEKLSGDAYTKEDLELLETLANQTSLAIQNARLYQEVESFNRTLKHRVNDQTKEIRKQNVHLEQLLEMKSEFLTIASHQLRTPTSIIRGYLSMMEDEGLSLEERLKYAHQAFLGMNRLERVINDILTATELEGKEIEVHYKPAQLEEVVKDVVQDSRLLAKEKGLKLESKILVELPKILCDELKLKEALTNLVSNAIFYTHKGGIKVTLDKHKKYAKITVQDTGVGFSPEEAKRMGDKFFRAPGVMQIHPNGSGLGLFIAKTFSEAMGGRLEFASEGKGKGSSFSLLLPINQKT